MAAAKAVVGTSVQYRQGDYSQIVTAIIGITSEVGTALAGDSVVNVETKSRDYLIDVCELAVVPMKGDLIVETDGTKRFTYQVIRPDGEQPWRFSDPGRTRYRIHTQLKAEETL